MNNLKIALLLFTIILSFNSLNAQEEQTNNAKNVEIKNSENANDTIKKDTIQPVNLTTNFVKDSSYELGGITVKGLQKFEEQTVKVFTGLKDGQEIKLPGDKLTSAIKKLYETKQFSNVEVYISKIDGTTVYLEFEVEELPQLNNITISGVKSSKAKELQQDAELKKGAMVTDNLIVTTQNYFKKKYQEKGFLKTKVSLDTKKDTSGVNIVNMLVHIDKGEKVKIKNITFEGNEAFTDKKLRKAMKNTKKKMFGRFWKGSKYIDADFKEDLENIVTTYSEKGHRDARITDHSLTWNDDNTLNLNLKIEEGKKYIFGDIKFIGNSKYTDEQLQRILRIEKGDTYNGKVLKDRVTGDGSPDSEDISTVYQNNGYLFSRVLPVETRVNNDSIDVEIRIYEDQQTKINKVTVNGNDRTNDHVIYREITTKPGYLYSKADIIRTIREIGQLGFFDAEAISPDIQPNFTDKTVDIDYTVAEKGSSQIELQGGYGGGSFIGTLGLSFNNFSTRNIFNKKAYKPLPMGDGQTLSLRLQKSRYYTTSSFSFTEPWLGGKKPRSLSFSIYNSKQFRYDYFTNKVDKDQRLNIVGATIGLGQRLKWPDDFFTLSQSISYQLYDLKDYPISTFSFSTGESNNLAYNITLARNSAGPNPIFPKSGSEFSIGAKVTFPYSLVNNKDYATIEDQEKYRWLEYYKASFKGKWYTALTKDLVLMTNTEFGILGHYNKKLGDSPFERFFVGGDGMASYQLDGRETIALRGYENGRLSSIQGGTIYNKFQMEVRYPITLKPSASIYALGFLEAGNSYDGFKNFNPFQLKRSAGLGLRIFMPAFGLLGIDFAHGFDPLPGGLEKSGWQTHFIIGQQF
ncbi:MULTISPECIES: outer membrane protein assembly factor BamA [Flavobacteriaceae]|uniref:Outer membrane protein assembly factor BamA n=2 Tax=Flavobacteriaceae TaxID=49546 RepID=A0A4Y8AR43_9FLAO|nr:MULTISPECIES: outer membrane protein assembly factor BamA [Flavobacteriaceae]TEW72471.1 outer membrane protein assembly factor BamA [Gramella jeungdoensis]GGK55486.1 outer membrane protein assembly factor BamA [Lutibacter litoralis]